jgi:DNA (cytosine-5)-methyltransferase 1
VANYGGRSNGWSRPVEEPMGSVTCTDSHSILQPPAATVSYYGKFLQRDIDEPLPTTTTVDRHGLLQPPAHERLVETFDGEALTDDEVEEIVMASELRMVQPEELKLAHGFEDWYRLGDWSKRDQVRLIGNANPPNTIEVLLERVVEAIWG